ncbi:MAG: hypothetical protein LBF59_01600 [Prevotellaceae bacterium]|jgi:hypothetical protein|nr:hypothetical protein [Prevotellaceae bacterium]
MNNPEQAAGAARGIVVYSSELRSNSTLTSGGGINKSHNKTKNSTFHAAGRMRYALVSLAHDSGENFSPLPIRRCLDIEGVENFNRKERNDIRKERKVKDVDL